MKTFLVAIAAIWTVLVQDTVLQSVGVHGFSTPTRPRVARIHLSATSTGDSSVPFVRSTLFERHYVERNAHVPSSTTHRYRIVRWKERLTQLRFEMRRQLRRSAAVLGTIAMLWFGTSLAVPPSPAHASSTAAPHVMEKVVTRPSLDDIVDDYVRKHMFNDDTFDPIESAYREAVDDRVKATYPKALSETMSTVLGESNVQTVAPKKDVKEIVANFVKTSLLTTSAKIASTFGVADATAMKITVGMVVGLLPMTMLYFGMLAGTISKRNMARTMKQRYGDTYTVDATIKPPDADDDDDNDNDDGDDDDGDDGGDSDDDDDSDKKK